ncbi:MAG: hypothetical protein Kow00127_09450 [Bacteroidales bacterium]
MRVKQFLLLVTLFFCWFSGPYLNGQEPYRGTALEQHRVSFSDIRSYDLLYPEVTGRGRAIEINEEHLPGEPVDPGRIVFRAAPGFYDPSANRSKDPSPLPEKDFQGLDDDGGSIPPDVNGAVGYEHIMVTLNTEVRITDREGNEIERVGTGAFWHPFPGSSGVFDPKIVFDHTAGRWVFVMASSGDPASSRVMLAVSATSDPTGDWFMYSFDGDPADTLWFDYPDWGFNQKWIVITGNMIQNQPVHSVVYIIPRADVYGFSPQVNYTRLVVEEGFSLIPAVTFDLEEEDIYLVNHAGGNVNGYGYIHLRKITGETATPELQDIGFIGVPYPWDEWSYFNNGDFAPQLGSEYKINTVDARLENMVQRNGKLWCVQHVYLPADNPERSSVQWWNIDLENAELLQWGRVDDPTGEMFRAFASIAVNAMEDVMIGFGSFSENQYASAAYAFRYATDEPNTLREPYIYKEGLAPYYKTYGGTRNRWGDYTFTCVDPLNDLDFWTIQEYAEVPEGNQDEWGVWWAKVNVEAAPLADFTANQFIVPPGGSVDFYDLSKYEPDSWLWSFEGATPGESTEQHPQGIIYNEPGSWDVRLIVSNAMGSDTLLWQDCIEVNTSVLPEVRFSASDTVPCMGDTVVLTDLSLYNPVEWEWTIEPGYVTWVNGTGPESPVPQVVFTYPFVYQVSLTATNSNGSAAIAEPLTIRPGGNELPFAEEFETWWLDSLAWEVQNPDGQKSWIIQQTGGLSFGTLSACMPLAGYTAYGQRDYLVSPPLNFYKFKNILLSFKHAYAQRNAAYTDSLIISVSTGCSDNWQRVALFGEDGTGSFATVEPQTESFVPSAPEDWCGSNGSSCTSVDLSFLEGLDGVRIRFESFNGFGNNIYIDSVRITADINKTIEIPFSGSVSLFPNPAQEAVTLVLPEAVAGEAALWTLSGSRIKSWNLPETKRHLLRLNHVPPGVYLLRINLDGAVTARRLIVR